jgi:hypothetical protein
MMSYKFDDIIQKQKIILSKTVKKNCAIPNNMTHGIRVFQTYLDLLQNFIKTLKSRGGTVKGTLLMSELLVIVSPFLYDSPAKK